MSTMPPPNSTNFIHFASLLSSHSSFIATCIGSGSVFVILNLWEVSRQLDVLEKKTSSIKDDMAAIKKRLGP